MSGQSLPDSEDSSKEFPRHSGRQKIFSVSNRITPRPKQAIPGKRVVRNSDNVVIKSNNETPDSNLVMTGIVREKINTSEADKTIGIKPNIKNAIFEARV